MFRHLWAISLFCAGAAPAETFGSFAEAVTYVTSHSDETFTTASGEELAFYPPLDVIWKLDGDTILDLGVLRDRQDGAWTIEWIGAAPRAFAFVAPPALTATGHSIPADIVEPLRRLDGATLAQAVGTAPAGTRFGSYFTLALPDGLAGIWLVIGDSAELRIGDERETLPTADLLEALQ